MNCCTFTGNLVRDPEVNTKSLSDGKAVKVANFTLAIRDEDSKRDAEPAFIDMEAWDSAAEVIEKYLVKGSFIIVRGAMRQDRWKDKKTGENRTKLKCRVKRFEFGPKAKKMENETPEDNEPVTSNDEDNVPF